jgi:hypothetical protein
MLVVGLRFNVRLFELLDELIDYIRTRRRGRWLMIGSGLSDMDIMGCGAMNEKPLA